MEMTNKVILLGTNSPHKIKEIKNMIACSKLNQFIVLSVNDLNETEDVVEDGMTFEENAFLKANYYAKKYDYFIVSDDTGLKVNALNGQPGLHSKRYAGKEGNDENNRKKLLKELFGKEDRSALFECCICLIEPNKKVSYFIGQTHGYILEEAVGNDGFGYDCIFYSDELNKSFGQSTIEEKSLVSHRGKAIAKMLKYIEENYGK